MESSIPNDAAGSTQSQKPILDPEALARLRGMTDDDGLSCLGVVVEAFLTDSKRRLADLHEAVAAADPELLRKSAHALKGAGSEVGALRVTETCQRLEDLGGCHNTNGANLLAIRLRNELDDVHSELKCELEQEMSRGP